ncbi:MAG: hypothetical protein KME08_09045 [Aphanothece sp. CMT-3BRIN-NPC111]|nr:hypothetical protein [Aphanothece sp. CMT-3BRIN-NPC111]
MTFIINLNFKGRSLLTKLSDHDSVATSFRADSCIITITLKGYYTLRQFVGLETGQSS